MVSYAGLGVVPLEVAAITGRPSLLIRVMIPKAAKRRFGVGGVEFGVVSAAKFTALSPCLRLIRHAIERAKGRFDVGIVALVVRFELHMVVGIVEKPDKPVGAAPSSASVEIPQ
jgi:hypothetical protein